MPSTEQRALFTAIYCKYVRELRRHVRSKVNDRELAEDLVQDVFAKTWIYLVRGGTIEKVRAFLHHSLKNAIVDGYRKHKTLSLDTLLAGGYEPSIDESKRMVDILDGRAVFALMDQLPSKSQEILRMKYSRHLSLKEMSRITGQSTNALAVYTHRALSRLKGIVQSTSYRSIA